SGGQEKAVCGAAYRRAPPAASPAPAACTCFLVTQSITPPRRSPPPDCPAAPSIARYPLCCSTSPPTIKDNQKECMNMSTNGRWPSAVRWSRQRAVVGLLTVVSAILFSNMLQSGRCEANDKDYKDVPLADIGVRLVSPTKDAKTGFIVGGKDATS